MDITTKDLNMLKKVVLNYEALLSEYNIYTEPPISIVIDDMRKTLDELKDFVQWLES